MIRETELWTTRKAVSPLGCSLATAATTVAAAATQVAVGAMPEVLVVLVALTGMAACWSQGEGLRATRMLALTTRRAGY